MSETLVLGNIKRILIACPTLNILMSIGSASQPPGDANTSHTSSDLRKLPYGICFVRKVVEMCADSKALTILVLSAIDQAEL